MALPSFGKRDWFLAVAVILFMAGLGAFRMAPGVTGLYHDDGIYVATAKALAEGHGYRLINLPDQPLQTKYPFFYPALLAGLWMLWPTFPDNLLLLQTFSLVLSSVSIGLAYLYLVRFNHATRPEALTAALLCASSPAMLFFATQTLAEPLFSLAIVVALWAGDDTAHRKPTSVIANWGRGGLIGVILLIRIVAVPIVAAIVAVLMWKSRRRLALLAGVTSMALPWIAWVGWAWLHHPPASVEYESVQPYISWWINDPATIVKTVLLNLPKLFHATVSIPVTALSLPSLTWPAILLGGLGWFAISGRSGSQHLPVSAVVTYGGLVLFWPWPPSRFIVPVAVLTTALVLASLRSLRRVIPTQPRRLLAAIAVLAALCFNLTTLVAEANATRRTGFPQLSTSTTVSWSDYQLVFDWLRANTRTDEVLASGLDSMVWAYTGRPAIRPFEPSPAVMFYQKPGDALGSVEQFAHVLKDRSVTFFVRLPMPGFAIEPHLERLVERLIRERPECLNERFRVQQDARFIIYEVDPGNCSGGSATGKQ